MKQVKVKASSVKVDLSYQRPPDDKRIASIAEKFEIDRVGVPVLSMRKDGSLWVLDGQHRFAAMIAAGLGDTLVMCLCHEGLTLEDEADWFLKLNNGRVAVDTMAKYKARIVAKEPIALEVNAIIRSRGLTVSNCPSAKTVSAIQAAEWVHCHRSNLAVVLDVLKPWAAIDHHALDGNLIKAVGLFLAECTEADPAHLRRRLCDLSPALVMQQIKTAARDFPRWVAACLTLRLQYNKKTRKPLPPLPYMTK